MNVEVLFEFACFYTPDNYCAQKVAQAYDTTVYFLFRIGLLRQFLYEHITL